MKDQFIIKKYKYKTNKAFGLVEIMVSISLIAIILSSMIATIYQSFIVITTSKQKSTAYELIQDQSNALQDFKKNNWVSIRDNTATNGSSPKYFQFIPDTLLASTATSVNNSMVVFSSNPNSTFMTDLRVGDYIYLSSATNINAKVTSILNNTSMLVDTPIGNGTSQTITRVAAYRINSGSFVQSNSGTSYTLNLTMDKALRNNTSSCSNYGNLENTQNPSCSYLEDNHYVWVIIGATWKDLTNHLQTVYSKFYINDYDNASTASYTYADMLSGSNLYNTTVTNVSNNGNLKLTKNGAIYNSTGKYISQIIDSGNTVSNYFSLDFIGDIPAGTSVNVYFKTSSKRSVFSSVSWIPITTCNTIPPTASPTLKTECNLYDGGGTPIAVNRYYQIQLVLNSTTPFTSTPNITSIETFYK